MPEEFNTTTEGETILLKRPADIGAPILFVPLSLHTPNFSQTPPTRASAPTFTSEVPVVTLSETTLRLTGQTVVKPTQRALTTVLNGTPNQASDIPSGGSTARPVKATIGGIPTIAFTIILILIIILGLITFCILRFKRRRWAVHSTSDVETLPDVRAQRMSQSAQFSTTPRPFLDFPFSRNRSSFKGITTGSARNLSVQDNQGNIEPVVDPFKDPIPIEENLPNNDDEVERVRNALDNLQVLTSQFEGEFQQLCILAQSGQLTDEDRLKLEEIRRTTGLTIPFDSRHDQHSIARSASSGSSSSLAPPSYHP